MQGTGTPPEQEILRHSLVVLWFNLIPTLPEESIRFHRLRAKAHNIAFYFDDNRKLRLSLMFLIDGLETGESNNPLLGFD